VRLGDVALTEIDTYRIGLALGRVAESAAASAAELDPCPRRERDARALRDLYASSIRKFERRAVRTALAATGEARPSVLRSLYFVFFVLEDLNITAVMISVVIGSASTAPVDIP
jgi:hypothetical protein